MASYLLLLFLTIVATANSARCPKYKVITTIKCAKKAKSLEDLVDGFEDDLGQPNNENQVGPIVGGYREIDWDGGVPFNMPPDFFNDPVARGFIFKAGKGNKFAVSDPAPQQPQNDFRFSTCVGAAQSKRFQVFSDPRLFTSLNVNKFTTTFRIPGTNKVATTHGLGGIFTDVVLKKQTWMDFFDKNGCRIWRINVPPRSKGLCFAGLIVVDPKNWKKKLPVIFKVVIKLGTQAITCRKGGYKPKRSKGDIVVMDDMFIAEPVAIRKKGKKDPY